MAKITLVIENLSELQRKSKLELLTGEPIRRGLTELGKIGERLLRPRAPWGLTSTLLRSIKYKVSKARLPTSVKMYANATNKRARYGYMLNAGGAMRMGKRIIYHYKGIGAPTHDWFTGIRPDWRGNIPGILGQVTKGIEANWGR